MPVKVREGVGLKGYYILEARNKITGKVTHRRRGNLIVTKGQNLLAQFLLQQSAPYTLGLTYQAIGTGTGTPALGDTQLGTETNRQLVTTHPSTTTNIATFTTFFTAAQSTVFIKEVGIFGGTTASGTANSGLLFSRALLSYDNSAGLNDITITYVLTIG